jgi:putative endonuclease
MFSVYALQSEVDGGLYIGLTNNIERRLHQHNSRQTRSTKGRAPLTLFYTESHPSLADARAREIYLKSGAGREFLKAQPGWRNRQTQRT